MSGAKDVSVRSALLVVEGLNRAELTQVVTARGWSVVMVLDTTRNDQRTALSTITMLAKSGAIDAIAMAELPPNLGVAELVRALSSLVSSGCSILSLREPWFSACTHGDMMVWLAARVRQTQADATRDAISRLKAEGRRIGRPRADIPKEIVLQMKANGTPLRAIAKKIGVGPATLHRFLKRLSDAQT